MDGINQKGTNHKKWHFEIRTLWDGLGQSSLSAKRRYCFDMVFPPKFELEKVIESTMALSVSKKRTTQLSGFEWKDNGVSWFSRREPKRLVLPSSSERYKISAQPISAKGNHAAHWFCSVNLFGGNSSTVSFIQLQLSSFLVVIFKFCKLLIVVIVQYQEITFYSSIGVLYLISHLAIEETGDDSFTWL